MRRAGDHSDGTADHRLRRLLAEEDGVAMVLVVAVAVIVFMLVTVVLMLSSLQVRNQASQEWRVKAMHTADAGLNAYLYELRKDPTFWQTAATYGPQTLEDGTWFVTATPPTETTPLTLRSVGTLPSREMTRVVVATVQFPTYAEYMFISDADINVGSGATITGKVRSNGDIDNDGTITGKAIAGGDVSGSGVFGQGYQERQQKIDFAQVSVDMAIMRTAAEDSGSFYGGSGGAGYKVVLSGSRYDLYRVTGGTQTGNLTTSFVGNYSVPAAGVLFFNEDVWVQGGYSTMVTIAGTRDIYVSGNLTTSGPPGKFSCGLVAQRNVIVPSWYPSLPTNMTLRAAMLAQTGTIYADLRDGAIKNRIDITGSMAYHDYGYFVRQSGSTVVAGFRTRTYSYDPALEIYPPPFYPMLRDGSLRVSTWIEE